MRIQLGLIAFCIFVAFALRANADDTVEFLDGKTLKGTILEIRKDAKEFDFEAQIGSQTLKRTYPYSNVHAVTYRGKRFEFTPKPADSGTMPNADGPASRTREQVLAAIEQAGKTPPSWLDSTQLNHPQSLDLSWPKKASGGWNSSKNVGQYLWDRVYPNTSRWRPGLKLIHQLADDHASNRELFKRDCETLGKMYFTLFQDYGRAAYWLRQAGVSPTQGAGVHLAECYWRLGNKQMALSMMRGKVLHFTAVKLLGDMGEIKDAISVAKFYNTTNQFNEAYLNLGDALRGAGRFDEAINAYQTILDRNRARNEEYLDRYKARASGAIEAIRLFEKVDIRQVADGTYTDSSTGYNGKLEVEVIVKNSKIESVKVTNHKEKQFYAALTDTTGQIVEKQSVQGIDGTSGATITSQAIIHASARALAQGSK